METPTKRLRVIAKKIGEDRLKTIYIVQKKNKFGKWKILPETPKFTYGMFSLQGFVNENSAIDFMYSYASINLAASDNEIIKEITY